MFVFSSLLGAGDPDAVLQVWSCESGLEGQYHLPGLFGHTTFDAAQGMIDFLDCRHALLSHVGLLIHQHPQVFLSVATLQLIVCSMSVFVLEIASTQVQHLALGSLELHEFSTDPPLKPVHVPLDGSTSLQHVDCPTQPGLFSIFDESAFDPTVSVADKDDKQFRSH